MKARTRILEGREGLQYAVGIYGRCRRLYIAHELAESIVTLAAAWGTNRKQATDDFCQKRQKWEQLGGYIEPLSETQIAEWFCGGSYIVAEAASVESEGLGSFDPVAQCVYRIPEGDWVVPLLDEARDEIYDRQFHHEIIDAGPERTGLIDYFGVLPEWSANNLAAAARYAGMLRVIQFNAERQAGHRIRHMVGLAFAI